MLEISVCMIAVGLILSSIGSMLRFKALENRCDVLEKEVIKLAVKEKENGTK